VNNARTFQQRLRWCQENGALSVADLSVWFQVAYPTVRAWCQGRIPRNARQSQFGFALAMLESAIREGHGLPIPFELSQHKRPEYVRALRDRFSRTHPTSRGIALRNAVRR